MRCVFFFSWDRHHITYTGIRPTFTRHYRNELKRIQVTKVASHNICSSNEKIDRLSWMSSILLLNIFLFIIRTDMLLIYSTFIGSLFFVYYPSFVSLYLQMNLRPFWLSIFGQWFHFRLLHFIRFVFVSFSIVLHFLVVQLLFVS